jgi:DNA-binding MarR family transcriptional regulator
METVSTMKNSREETMPEVKIADQLAYIVASANRRLEEELQESLRPAGVPIEQLRILEVLDRAGPCPMGQLADHALVEPPTLTKIIDRMVSESLVFRAPDPDDRRRVLILLAPAGKAVYKRLRKVSTAQEQRLARQLSQGKANELRNLLRELIGP